MPVQRLLLCLGIGISVGGAGAPYKDVAASRYFIYRDEAGIGTDIIGDGGKQAIVLPKELNMRAEHAFFQVKIAPSGKSAYSFGHD